VTKHPHLVAQEEDVIANGGIAAAEVFFRLSLAARLRIVVDVLAALSALHTISPRAIVHGGVLLRATFIDTNGCAKLGHADAQSYAPESLLGDAAAISARTDVYGAGVMLWEAITGHELFGIDAPEAILKKQLGGRIAKALPPAREKWAGALLPVVDRALAVNPSDRYASIAEMAAALRIAVRARLMTHEDVIEEIWPAATTPKVQSGVQPAGEPMVAEAFEVEQVSPTTLAMPVEEANDEPAASAPLTSSPARRSHTRIALAASIGLAFALACGIFSVVHVRAARSAVHAAVAVDEISAAPAAVDPPSTPEIEVAKPVQAPAAATVEVKPKKETRKPKTKSRFYDPSTI
jgi:hypothetical protein